jgi:hypothetical protein
VPAQRLARQELAKGIYSHESFWQWVLSKLSSFYQRVGNEVPGGWWALVALVAILAVIVTIVFTGVGPIGRSRRTKQKTLLGGIQTLTAKQHRELARQSAANNDFSTAIIEMARAIAASLEEQEILVPGPARTADELAREAGSLLPDHAAELNTVARLFDDVCYGARPGTPDGYARAMQLDEAISI